MTVDAVPATGVVADARAFVAEEITPHAGAWDRQERLPAELVAALGARGWLGALVPTEWGGAGVDAGTFGALHEVFGAGCSSVRSVLTVHSMVIHAVRRWGSAALRQRWLPQLATGARVGAFALSEPGAGSDASSLATVAEPSGGGFVLSGTKRWITYAQAADVFLAFARCPGGPAAFLLERDTPGLEIVPISGLLGTRASMTGELRMSGCVLPAEAMVGRIGFGVSAVATSALDIGRLSVAAGSVGVAQAALEASAAYAGRRVQFGRPIGEHQLVQRMITDMIVGVRAARLLCERAAALKDAGDPQTVAATWEAKYFASRMAFRTAADAVQIHGANGCGEEYPVQRLLRDAKIAEIIEGSTELQQATIAQAYLHLAANGHRRGGPEPAGGHYGEGAGRAGRDG